jgi:hypothetical protein
MSDPKRFFVHYCQTKISVMHYNSSLEKLKNILLGIKYRPQDYSQQRPLHCKEKY